MNFPKHLLMNLLLGATCISSCTTPQMLLSEEVKTNAAMMPVKGRQGLMLNQRLSFGNYSTDKVKRSATSTYDLNFLHLEWAGGKEKLSYTLYSPTGSVEVQSLGRLRTKALRLDAVMPVPHPLIEDFTSVYLHYEDMYSVMLFPKGQQQPWHLLVVNRNDLSDNSSYKGLLVNNAGTAIEVVPVRELEGVRNLGRDITGFEFRAGGKAIGAVEMINNGRIWIGHNVEPEQQLVLAGAASALLLQTNIEEVLQQTTTLRH